MATTTTQTTTALALLALNVTGSTSDAAITNPNDAITLPLTDMTAGVFAFQPANQNEVIVPIATGNDNSAFTITIEVWVPIKVGGRIAQYTPFVLADLTCTTCTRTGVTGGGFGTAWRYCDTIVPSVDRSLNPPGVRIMQASTADNRRAAIVLDGFGGANIVVRTKIGAATAVNILHGGLSG